MRFDFLANILFPPVCVACRRRIGHGVICDPCFASIEIRRTIVLSSDFPYVLTAAAHYEDKTVQALIHNLKFRSIQGAAEPLAELMVQHARIARFDFYATDQSYDFVVIPIPLSRKRLRSRGYNQAELIARAFAECSGLTVDTTSLVRVKNIKPQTETNSEAERRQNIRGAFAIQEMNSFAIKTTADTAIVNDQATRPLVGKNILLIDDVSTTGSTFLEAAKTLKAAGAQKIVAFAAAKT